MGRSGDDLLVGVAEKIVRRLAVFDRAQFVDESGRLQHAAQAGQDVQVGA